MKLNEIQKCFSNGKAEKSIMLASKLANKAVFVTENRTSENNKDSLIVFNHVHKAFVPL